jgi:Polyketide cyclase / dehydrase and lipid transport
MLTYILIAVAVIIVLFLIVVATRPADFRVTRSTNISAPPPTVFAQVNDFHNWEAWSPWAKLDPNSKTTYEGAPAGKGAIFKWAGNKKVGAGSMTILDSHPVDLVRIKLEFLKPFKATNTAEFTFKPLGSQTLVEWSMFGKNNFFFKAFSLFVDCDKMIGKDFEKGLAQMKSIAESSPA